MTQIIQVDQIADYVRSGSDHSRLGVQPHGQGQAGVPAGADGHGFVQCVAFKGDLDPDTFEKVQRIPQETSVIITGPVRADPRAPGIPGGFEIGIKQLEILQTAAEDYPMALKEHGVSSPWIIATCGSACPRSGLSCACVRRSSLPSASGLIRMASLNMDTPILTPAACEGTTTLFETPYFDEGIAYLAQSGQLYNEADIFSFGRVYCFGPTFRAEKSKTRRHLTEFWMVEPEIAFCDLDQLMEIEEQFVTHIVKRVLRDRLPELKSLGRDLSRLERIEPPFPRISYDEAAKMLAEIRARNRRSRKEGAAEVRMGHGFRRSARDRADQPLRQAGVRLRLPHGGQGFLYGTLARPPGGMQKCGSAGA